MSIEEQAKNLERSLHTLEGLKKKPWMSAQDRREVVEEIRHRIAAAEATLRLPVTAETAHARQQLILWTEMANGTLKHPEYQ